MKKSFLLSLGTLFFLIFSVNVNAQCSKSTKTAEASKSTSTEVVAVSQDAGYATTTMNIDGMKCAEMCTSKIKAAVNKIDGVAEINIDYDTKVATIAYDAEKTNAEAINKTITESGYTVATTTSKNAAIAPADESKKSKKDCAKTCTKSKKSASL